MRVISLFIVFVLNCFPVQAEDYLDMDLESLMKVKITGSTLREESLETVPSSVTVFTHQEIKTLGFDYLYELLGTVPGFQVSRNADSPSGYTVSSRARRNSAEAREVLLVVDGQVLADPRTGSADGSLPHFPLAQVERVEVISGPGSAIYGSGAFTGVINIVTRKESRYLSIAVGSFEKRKLNLGYDHTLGDWRTSLFLNADVDQGEDYRHTFTSQPVSTTDPRDIYSIHIKSSSAHTLLTGSFYRTHSENFLIAELVDNELNQYTQNFRHFGIEHQIDLHEKWKMKLLLGYTRIEQEFSTRLTEDGALVGASNPASNEALKGFARFAGESYSFKVANDHELNQDNNVQWGLEFQQRQETDASAFSNFDLEQLADGSFPINYYGNFLNQFAVGSGESQNMWGLYGQWIHAFANDLRLTLGARYDDYELFDSRISPRVGLVKELTTSAQLKILYGEAYRAPSLSETGLMNNPVLIGNPDVESELVKTWELVLQNQWQSAHTTFTLFHNAYEQPISAGFQQNVRTYVNGENQSAQGVTFNLFSSLADNWVLKANATYFMDLPDPAFRESEKLANLMLIWTQSKWNMGLAYHYQGARETLISTTEKIQLPSGQSVNINVGYEIQKNLLLELKIKNLFDEYQVSPPQGLGIAKGVPFRGIESVLAVEWSW